MQQNDRLADGYRRVSSSSFADKDEKAKRAAGNKGFGADLIFGGGGGGGGARGGGGGGGGPARVVIGGARPGQSQIKAVGRVSDDDDDDGSSDETGRECSDDSDESSVTGGGEYLIVRAENMDFPPT